VFSHENILKLYEELAFSSEIGVSPLGLYSHILHGTLDAGIWAHAQCTLLIYHCKERKESLGVITRSWSYASPFILVVFLRAPLPGFDFFVNVVDDHH